MFFSHSRTLTIIAGLICLFVGSVYSAKPQDNWYLYKKIGPETNTGGVAISPEDTILVAETDNDKISEWDLDGTLLNEFGEGQIDHPIDLDFDKDGNFYVACYNSVKVHAFSRTGTHLWSVGSRGTGQLQFDRPWGLAVSKSDEIFICEDKNRRIQVLNTSGEFIRTFGRSGTLPSEFSRNLTDVVALENGKVAVLTVSPPRNSLIHNLYFFNQTGEFIRSRFVGGIGWDGGFKCYLSQSNDGRLLYTTGQLRLSVKEALLMDSDGNTVQSYINNGGLGGFRYRTAFHQNGDLIQSDSGLYIWRRAYRTKGAPQPNAIPSPKLLGYKQREGTNLVDIDIEIVDFDDETATFGIIAAVDGDFSDPQKWILIKSYVENTGEKVGSIVSTNTLHRITWDVRKDWDVQQGDIKFQVLCKDSTHTHPIDLHFLKLPLPSGELEINRVPIFHYDIEFYLRYLLAIHDQRVQLSNGEILNAEGVKLMGSDRKITQTGKDFVFGLLGCREATVDEVNAAMTGLGLGTSPNKWSPKNPIRPRKLLINVNELGFETNRGNPSPDYWWVVKP